MTKKCMICGDPALYAIRGTNDFYCYDCAAENFSDIDMLEKIGEHPLSGEDPEDLAENNEQS